MKLLRKILFPFVPVYYIVTGLRNKLYDWKIFSSKSYAIPIICVGNLSVGGTGKTPMIEYLIRLLKVDKNIATLSRGYKRSTSGFLLADRKTGVNEIGDEPFQFHNKFSKILVAVDEDRQHGIESLLEMDEAPSVILLDDAYQHRKVSAGLNILLTAYHKLYCDDWVLPSGDLREPKNGARRAQVVVVTKCPTDMNSNEKKRIEKKLNLREDQKLFFSSIQYDQKIYGKTDSISLDQLKNQKFTLVTGIANSKPLVEYLKLQNLQFEHLEFNDHYSYSNSDLETFKSKKLLLTTEKDYVRLQGNIELNLYYLSIKLMIDQAEKFDGLIRKFVTSF